MSSTLTSCLNTQAAEARFRPEERALLLATPGIGAGVIKRLEEIGIHSFAQIHEMGVQGAVRHVCEHLGTTAWANRRRALSKALAAVGVAGFATGEDGNDRRPCCGRRSGAGSSGCAGCRN